MKGLSVVVCWAVAGPAVAAAASPAELLREAHAAYKAGRFGEAVDRYQRAIKAGGGSADAYYDLGTAYYKLGKTGQAILAYERALVREPRHEDARANLAIAHRRAGLEKAAQELGLGREGMLGRMARAVTPGEAAVVFLALWFAFFGALAARRLVEPSTARSVLGLAAIVLLLLAVTAGGFFGHRVYRAERRVEGVLLEPKVSLMEPHGGSWKAVRSLPEGLRVRVLSRNEGWVQIRLPGGLTGYVREAQVEPI